jgi:hypothetical protein
MGDHFELSRVVPLNSSSNVQCHVPAGGATGGAVPAHGPLSAGAVGGAGAVLGVVGADAAVPGAPRGVEEEIVDPPPDGAAGGRGAEVVVVVVASGHVSAI